MPSFLHELLIELFRDQPELAPTMLRDALGVPLPAYQEARVENANLNQLRPVEYDADLVVLLEDGKPVFGIVVEVQLSPDPDKLFAWIAYLAILRARLRAPTVVLVVAPDPAVARWAGQPVSLGPPGLTFAPMVLGRNLVPWVTDEDQAEATPEAAMLSALAHGNEPGGVELVIRALEAVKRRSSEKAALYYDILWETLNEATRQALEALMQTTGYEFKSPFAREYFAKGKAEGKAEGEAEGEAKGKAEALLKFLSARGLAISDAQRATILGCADMAQLERWIEHAASAASVEEILR
jgi:hypothetical protein